MAFYFPGTPDDFEAAIQTASVYGGPGEIGMAPYEQKQVWLKLEEALYWYREAKRVIDAL